MIFNLDPSALWQLRLTNLRKTRLAIVVPLLRSTTRLRQKTALAGRRAPRVPPRRAPFGKGMPSALAPNR